jgi:integrase
VGRRAKGEGSIHKRKDGYWAAQITVGYKPDGRPIRKSVYASKKKEVAQKLADLKERHERGDFGEGARQLVKDFLRFWLKQRRHQVKPRTIELHTRYVESKIVPVLGNYCLVDLKPVHIQELVGDIATGTGTRTAAICRTLLHTAFRQAVRWGLIAVNPVEAVDPVKHQYQTPQLWSNDQLAAFLHSCEDHRLYPAYYLAITTGLRRGELLGLQWQDLENGVLRIGRSLTAAPGGIRITTPKTARGSRAVAIPSDTQALLDAHREGQRIEFEGLGLRPDADTFIFTTRTAGPIHPRNFERTWYRLQEAARLPRIRFHDLRHMHVSMLIRTGTVDVRTVADRVGHADPAFTLRRYAHVFEEQRRASAKPLSELLGLD